MRNQIVMIGMNEWTNEENVGRSATTWCSRKNTNGKSETMYSKSGMAITTSFTSLFKALGFTLQNEVFDLNSASLHP